jgi:two-component system, chemotaxis family, chemotaxis protein CheY
VANILLVDDSATFREEIKMDLIDAGYSVFEAVNGEEGLKMASEGNIDLIISDLNMPVMDGLTMCSHLRAQGINTPIFMLTTQVNPDLKAEAGRLSVKGWIVKPPNKGALLKGIAKVLSMA